MQTTDLVNWLQQHAGDFHPVVPFDPAIQKLLPLDFTAANTALSDEMLKDTEQFSRYIDQELKNAGAIYGIGGYNEHRTIYSRSEVFNAADLHEEPRRLHLGTDIWGAAGTPVMAPVKGEIHSFAFNDQYGDYGATIIVMHEAEGFHFFTLYGHLSLDSIQNLGKGKKVGKGEVIARFGLPFENGHWPPHLHFQLIADMQGYTGDFPGVCRYTERETWLANCPDPDLVLGLNTYATGSHNRNS